MKIIVGLGNPGREYASTCHNLGFMVVDELGKKLSARSSRNRFHADIAEVVADDERVVLLKPQTYMNLSGISVRECARWYKVTPEEILVVADDIDLPFGALRLRPGGGSGGHNGIKSIVSDLGTDQVPRLRIGVGRGSGDATRQVLARFSPEESLSLPRLVQSAADCALDWLRLGVIDAMNRCNRKPEARSDNTAIPGEAVTPAG